MKTLPLGIQTFSELIEKNHVYVDKTEDIYKLFADGGKYYFLSRPRQFGKSLLISTLKEIFSGNKELFKGLWIHDKIEWNTHPVIHIDFSVIEYRNAELLEQSLMSVLETIAASKNIQLTGISSKDRFAGLIRQLAQDGKVVILVDEYDKPIIDFVDNPEISNKNRTILRNFYSVIKASDEYIKFAILTGVSKFSKVSVFSGLNNLRDITMSKQFSTLLGYTQAELLHHFNGYIDRLAKELEKDEQTLLEQIRTWYNGYSWDGRHFVYNPYSILSLFTENTFNNYWFSSGTPGFLIRMIQERNIDITRFDNLPVSDYAFDSFEPETIEAVPLLFQAGYLTIKEIFTKQDKRRYRLSYPNKEVHDSFLSYLFQAYTQKEFVLTTEILDRVGDALGNGDLDRLINELKSLFASISYQIFIDNRESYYHTVIYLVLKLAGADIFSEESTNKGRIDAVMETDKKIVIMEFKLGKDAEKTALEQIKEKKYYEKYLNGDKEIVLMGVGLDSEERNIGAYLSEKVEPTSAS